MTVKWDLENDSQRPNVPPKSRGGAPMARHMEFENRSGPRYLASLEVKAEWDEPTGTHIVAEGTTENVGPEGTLVHLPRQLPDVGSTVRLEVMGENGELLQVIAEVLRIERNPGHPLAALQLVGETDEWKGLVWEPAAPRVAPPPPVEESEADEDAEDDDDLTH
ncbi:MAG: hypothetical protein DMF69_07785 [Acidobacteria bacterium]|nr:MAG: hypothetical protein DMF69_07785 [Acidobacteriota bacterium]